VRTRHLVLIALAALLAGMLVANQAKLRYWYTQWVLSDTPRPAGGSQALVPFTLPDLEGRSQSTEQWRGRILLINFWATWCPPCKEEIPLFMDFQERYGGRGLQIVGVALDERDAVADYRDGLLMNYPVLLADRQGLDLMKAYGNLAGVLPYSVVIDRQGRIRHRKMGAYRRQELEDVLAPLLQ